MSNNKQVRGHCQCCGNDQAVVRGRMSQHGYTVRHGWFNGVCMGHQYQPVEQDRAVTDSVVRSVRADVAALLQRAADLQRGTIDPATVNAGSKLVDGKWVDQIVPYCDGTYWQQERAVDNEVRRCEYRAREGKQFADYLESVAKKFHGKPLAEVARKAPAARIDAGEKRVAENGLVLTARYQEGARVTYTYPYTAHKPDPVQVQRTGWMGTQAWRKLALVAQ